MNRRDSVIALLALCTTSLAARAQPSERIYRVGWILPTTPVTDATSPTGIYARNFVGELRARGYVEGKNLVLDIVSAEGHQERYAKLVAELLRRKPDVIMVSGSQLAAVTKRATSEVPIVMNSVAQPVKYGLVASLARPGGNVTGLAADASAETEVKRLGLLKELVPKLSRVSCLATNWIWEGPFGQAVRQAGPALGIELLYAEHRPADLETTFANIVRQQPDALLVVLSPDVYGQRKQIADFALNARIPAICPFAEMVEAGGLISYGYDIPGFYRIAARYVDKIFKGAKPSELPVEQPALFEFVINLKTAKALGITIPQSFRLRADRVIE